MIIWTGWGILVFLITGLVTGLSAAGIGAVLGDAASGGLGVPLGLTLSAIPLYLLGRWLNAPVPGYDPRTGQPTYFRNRHTFFFIPMQYFGFVLPPIALVVVVAFLITTA